MSAAEYNDLELEENPTRGRLRTPATVFGTLLVFAAAAVAGLSLPWRGDRPAEPPRLLSSARGSGPLRAGAAAISIGFPEGTPIGGYARLSYRSEGTQDAVGARALYLEVPGLRAAVVSADILLVPEPLARRVEALLSDLALDVLLVGATHTHAGPGGFDERIAFERGALGSYDPLVFDRLAAAIADAARRAAASAAPARLALARGTAEPIAKARSGGRLDGRMASLRVLADGGEAIGELLVFPAHPTILGKANRRLSAEWPGKVAARTGRGVRVVLQGAIGDQSVRVAGVEEEGAIDRYADAVVAQDDALTASSPVAEATLATASVTVTLPPPSPGAVPALLRRAAATLAWDQIPGTARITALRIGPLQLVAVPAEPTGAVGARWRAVAGEGSEIVSLVGGYAGYVDEPERVRRGEGEAVRSYYGPELAERLERGIEAAARAVAP